MKLTVVDRMILLAVLPKEGDITTLRILKDLQSSLSFSEEELASLNFVHNKEQNRTEWVADAVGEVEVEIGRAAFKLIADNFQKLSEAKKLTLDHLTTFEKFMSE